jgi:two-component system response regulator
LLVPDLLIVDDSRDDVELILRAVKLHDAPLEASVAHDGQEALDILQLCTRLPRLVLMDLHLHRLNGIEVLQRLRSNETTSCLPVVLFSGSGSPSERLEAYRTGANSWVHKPTNFKELQQVVGRILSYWLSVNPVADPSTDSAQ